MYTRLPKSFWWCLFLVLSAFVATIDALEAFQAMVPPSAAGLSNGIGKRFARDIPEELPVLPALHNTRHTHRRRNAAPDSEQVRRRERRDYPEEL
ncbi:uncharacterized protein SPPG_09113 [Spizellomyces punctatus DAOM BR117]|uniref:Secreted protein n=1 Tax=Spizellomyces punctatus (strain DAOM BR117) TaxID=645134 RepID=A0A0L0HL45_SPIPD|nr:uncharacterized protein SPPG_09113 [Spizellomyces punctatus DAOM BR117]KND01605.1 hypothetical protein SPPG_09113 [Spizellomyces punctatus DAOM BR117]|eukprot:XP_016609644.1 hypothetical protein SPPG_09113 [Spizellomyces punctatus DAOM BR117]